MTILDYLVRRRLRCNPPPTDAELQKLRAKIDFDLDVEFNEFIASCNGASGFTGDDCFIQLWSIDDLVALNPYYSDVVPATDLFFLGGDGSNSGYAFNKTNGHIVSIDFLEIGKEEPVEMGATFKEFVEKMESKS